MADFMAQLVLLLVGIGFTAFYAPRVARRWDERRREMEIKTRLVAEMSRCVMTFDADVKHWVQASMAAASTVAAIGPQIEECTRAFDVSRCVIGTELEVYFPEAQGCVIPSQWDHFTSLFIEFSKLPPSRSDIDFATIKRSVHALPLTDEQRRKAIHNSARFPRTPAWSELEQLLLAEKLRLIMAVRTTAMQPPRKRRRRRLFRG
jgi:hypothetical protein